VPSCATVPVFSAFAVVDGVRLKSAPLFCVSTPFGMREV